MPRRVDPNKKKTKRDWRWYANIGLNGIVALSMILGTVFLFTGVRAPAAAIPTLEVPTAAPDTVVPTVAPATPVPTVGPTAVPTATPTPKASASNYTFAVAGDSRDGDVIYQKLLSRVMSDGNEFLIHTGDLVPSGSIENWQHFQALMNGFTLPFFPMPGNHELLNRGKISDYIKFAGAPTPPAGSPQLAHYSFDRGAVHFAIVDSSLGSLLDNEFTWMDNDLATSQAPVKMVFLHHPPFDPAGTNHVMTNGADKFMQMVKQRGVKYVFAGHIHCYEEADSAGVKLIITGGGGAPLSCPPMAGGFYHYVRVTVHGENVATEVVKIEE